MNHSKQTRSTAVRAAEKEAANDVKETHAEHHQNAILSSEDHSTSFTILKNKISVRAVFGQSKGP